MRRVELRTFSLLDLQMNAHKASLMRKMILRFYLF